MPTGAPRGGYGVWNNDVYHTSVGAWEGLPESAAYATLKPVQTDPPEAFQKAFFGHCYTVEGRVGDTERCRRMYGNALNVHPGKIVIPRSFWGIGAVHWGHLEGGLRRFHWFFPPCCPLWSHVDRSRR